MGKTFTPFVAAEKRVPEFTLRATVLGIILGVFFNLGNVYLGLKVGMTVSASIPAAVLSMAILRLFFKNVSILENNIVQTIATVGEGLAAGIIFTIPALFMLGETISNFKIFILSLLGGILGILFMIPMRRYIIVKEHGLLPFPEGTACAEILKAGASSIQNAVRAGWGILVGVLYKIATGVFKLWDDLSTFVIKPFEQTEFRIEGTPALLGVGFIIGPEIACLMLAGGVAAWWVLIPLIKMFAAGNVMIFPATKSVDQMTAMDIWSNYIRYIGAGTVAVGGIYNLIRIIPLTFKSVYVGFQELFQGREEGILRTDLDISMAFLIVGSLVIILLLWLFPGLNMNLFTIILLAVLGYFFTAVTSITVGLVGSSSNPASGMVLTTLLITGFIFSALGWTERIYLIMIIMMSAVVNVAICLAATTSQDLKTGYLVGATPRSQQLSEMIGLILPSALIGTVLVLLNKAYTFGSSALPAPQATLVSIISSGIIEQKLPAVLVVFGVMIGIFLLLMRSRVLPFAIGLYLPLEISTSIFLGGVARAVVNRFSKTSSAKDSGILTASGMIAGDAIIGVVIALLTVLGAIAINKKAMLGPGFGLLFFLLLAIGFTLSCFKKTKIRQ